jgi:hypothetical protein
MHVSDVIVQQEHVYLQELFLKSNTTCNAETLDKLQHVVELVHYGYALLTAAASRYCCRL